ncbi:MAG TPA: hypothetical protein VGL35_03325 [Rhizomicrobium sp.]|jgi:hypothetical protein
MAFLDRIIALAILAYFVGGSAVLVVRRLRLPKDSPELRRPPAQIDLLPARWRRWVLGKRRPRNSERDTVPAFGS